MGMGIGLGCIGSRLDWTGLDWTRPGLDWMGRLGWIGFEFRAVLALRALAARNILLIWTNPTRGEAVTR
eukprot:2443267-Lingulodinium_polyedra.AAC.1